MHGWTSEGMLKEMVQITKMYHFEILSPNSFSHLVIFILMLYYSYTNIMFILRYFLAWTALPPFISLYFYITNILTFLLFWSLTNAILNYCHYFVLHKRITQFWNNNKLWLNFHFWITNLTDKHRPDLLIFKLSNRTAPANGLKDCSASNHVLKSFIMFLTTKPPVFAVAYCSCKWKIPWISRNGVSRQLIIVQFLVLIGQFWH